MRVCGVQFGLGEFKMLTLDAAEGHAHHYRMACCENNQLFTEMPRQDLYLQQRFLIQIFMHWKEPPIGGLFSL